MAGSALEAINKDKKAPVDDVYVDADWQKENMCKSNPVGF